MAHHALKAHAAAVRGGRVPPSREGREAAEERRDEEVDDDRVVRAPRERRHAGGEASEASHDKPSEPQPETGVRKWGCGAGAPGMGLRRGGWVIVHFAFLFVHLGSQHVQREGGKSRQDVKRYSVHFQRAGGYVPPLKSRVIRYVHMYIERALDVHL